VIRVAGRHVECNFLNVYQSKSCGVCEYGKPPDWCMDVAKGFPVQKTFFVKKKSEIIPRYSKVFLESRRASWVVLENPRSRHRVTVPFPDQRILASRPTNRYPILWFFILR
jgi:hypothetical protein